MGRSVKNFHCNASCTHMMMGSQNGRPSVPYCCVSFVPSPPLPRFPAPFPWGFAMWHILTCVIGADVMLVSHGQMLSICLHGWLGPLVLGTCRQHVPDSGFSFSLGCRMRRHVESSSANRAVIDPKLSRNVRMKYVLIRFWGCLLSSIT